MLHSLHRGTLGAATRLKWREAPCVERRAPAGALVKASVTPCALNQWGMLKRERSLGRTSTSCARLCSSGSTASASSRSSPSPLHTRRISTHLKHDWLFFCEPGRSSHTSELAAYSLDKLCSAQQCKTILSSLRQAPILIAGLVSVS